MSKEGVLVPYSLCTLPALIPMRVSRIPAQT